MYDSEEERRIAMQERKEKNRKKVTFEKKAIFKNRREQKEKAK